MLGTSTTEDTKLKDNQQEKVKDLFKKRWIIGFLAVWLTCGMIPLALVWLGTHVYAFADSRAAEIAGTIGDAFGLANSFFSAAALLFVIGSIRLQQKEIEFARKEWEANTKSQMIQVHMMRESAKLTAINHIHDHYSPDYGANDQTGILSAMANGYRRWATRAAFDTIDRSLAEDRKVEVEKEMERLAGLLAKPKSDVKYLRKVAESTSCLLSDKRVRLEIRQIILTLNGMFSEYPQPLTSENTEMFDQFREQARVFQAAYDTYSP